MRFLSSGQAKRSWQRAVAAVVCVSFAFGFATPVSFADTTMVVPPTPTLNAPAQGSVVPDGSPVITGWVTSGLLVEVHIDGSFNGWATVQESDSVADSFYYTPFLPLTPGGHTYHARAKDPETGERSLPTQEMSFLVAEKLPAPTVFTPVVRADKPLQPLVVGLTYGNTTVEVFVDGVSYGKVTVTGDPVKVDDFALQTTTLSQGKHMVYAVATDSLGRTSANSDDMNFTVSKPQVSTVSTTSESTTQPSESDEPASQTDQDKTTETSDDDEVVLGEDDDTAEDSDDVAPTNEDENATEDEDSEESNTNEASATTDEADDNDRSALVTWIVVIAVLVIILALRLRGNSGGKTGTDGTARSVFTGGHSSTPTTEKKDDVPPPPPPPPSSSSY